VWSLPRDQGAQEALAASRDADLVVFVAGLTHQIEGEEMRVETPGFSGGDRTSLDLPGPQQRLLERVTAVGKPVVLVLMNGSALGVNWADARVGAILEAWYPGGQGGDAIARVIAGDVSPAGRLPVTFYRSVDQLPPLSDYSMANRTYRYFTGEVLYPFGYGLSYTSFAYARPRVSQVRVRADALVRISVDVTNTGGVDGDEVVQLYATHPGVPGAPTRALVGFERIHLARGETRTVRFTLRDRELSTVSPEGVRRITPGPVELWIGGGQPGQRAPRVQAPGVTARFEITSAATLPN
jgi:beta-glucosidase